MSISEKYLSILSFKFLWEQMTHPVWVADPLHLMRLISEVFRANSMSLLDQLAHAKHLWGNSAVISVLVILIFKAKCFHPNISRNLSNMWPAAVGIYYIIYCIIYNTMQLLHRKHFGNKLAILFIFLNTIASFPGHPKTKDLINSIFCHPYLYYTSWWSLL